MTGTPAPRPVPLHPEATADPDVLRWVVPVGVTPFTGPAHAVPRPLGVLLEEGVLAAVELEPAAVLTRLGAAGRWQRDGARVRSALHAALATPDGWTSGDRGADGESPGTGADALLGRAVEEVLAGEVGDYIRLHGGRADVLAVGDGVVTVRMGGACRGCPAAAFTLHLRLEAAVRCRCPWLREVRAA